MRRSPLAGTITSRIRQPSQTQLVFCVDVSTDKGSRPFTMASDCAPPAEPAATEASPRAPVGSDRLAEKLAAPVVLSEASRVVDASSFAASAAVPAFCDGAARRGAGVRLRAL